MSQRRGRGRWNDVLAMQEMPACVATAHQTPFGPVIQSDGELVLDNPLLAHA